MKQFGFTDIGGRYSNEDSMLILELESGQVVAAVIDGCGKALGVAHIFSGRLKDEIEAIEHQQADAIEHQHAEALGAQQAEGLSDQPAGGISLDQLKAAVTNINNSLIEFRTRVANIGNCVLTACLIDKATGEVGVVHCGDCRAYHYSDGELRQITIDDSYVGRLLYAGGITESEARTHPMRHQIFKSLCREVLMDDDNFISTYTCSASSGDYMLLCSDGIYDTLGAYDLKSILWRTEMSIEDKVHALITLARESGSTDNATAILIEL